MVISLKDEVSSVIRGAVPYRGGGSGGEERFI